MKDEIYKTQNPKVGSFRFDETVAHVFDDMLVRSIPFYKEVNEMSLQLLMYHFKQFFKTEAGKSFIDSKKSEKEKWICYDLGSSTGTFLRQFSNRLVTLENYENWYQQVELIGIDKASAMNEQARQHLEIIEKTSKPGIVPQFQIANLTEFEFPDVANIKVWGVILQYTLQFIHPLKKTELLQKIYNALMPGGFLLLSEKIIEPTPLQNEFIQSSYEIFKEHKGYNQLEIARKRKALQNVLTPLTLEELSRTLRVVGFTTTLLVLKGYCFATLLAFKQ